MNRRQPLVALRALRNLIRDPERTEEVFVITRALAGDAIERGHARFAGTEIGARVLGERRELLASLADRAALARLPDGSLGRAYLRFVESNGITAEGLVEASDVSQNEYAYLSEDQALYARRLRDMHDIWHVATGYSTQPFGEVCVLAFTYPQTRNLGIGVIALVGALKVARAARATGVLKAVWQAWRSGRRAAWLPAQDWEMLLGLPLETVRSQLRLGAPTRFQEITNYRPEWEPTALLA